MTASKLFRVGAVAAASLLAALAVMPAQAQTDLSGSAKGAWVREADEVVYRVPFVSLRTRADVRAEAIAALRQGDTVHVGDETVTRAVAMQMGVLPAPPSSLTRAEVLAEAAASRARGDYLHIGDETLSRYTARGYGLPLQPTVDVRLLSAR